MAGSCTLCHRKDRSAVDAAIIAGVSSLRSIAERYGVSAQSVLRHREHIKDLVAKRAETEVEALWRRLLELEAQYEEVRELAQEAGQLSAAISAMRGKQSLLECRLKALGAFEPKATPVEAPPPPVEVQWFAEPVDVAS